MPGDSSWWRHSKFQWVSTKKMFNNKNCRFHFYLGQKLNLLNLVFCANSDAANNSCVLLGAERPLVWELFAWKFPQRGHSPFLLVVPQPHHNFNIWISEYFNIWISENSHREGTHPSCLLFLNPITISIFGYQNISIFGYQKIPRERALTLPLLVVPHNFNIWILGYLDISIFGYQNASIFQYLDI